jgi:Ca2+-binding RTX toxin-like protein
MATINGNTAVNRLTGTGARDVNQVVTVTVNGAYTISIRNLVLGNDTLIINTNVGNDTVDARGLAGTVGLLTLNGGVGNDFLLGGSGNDTINGEVGDDVMFGFDGIDTFTGGVGNDTANGGNGTDVQGTGIEVFTQ